MAAVQSLDEVRIAGLLGLSMDGLAAYHTALGRWSVRGERSPFAMSIRGSWLPARDGTLREDGYECWRTTSGFGVASRRAHGAAGCRRRVVMGFVVSRGCVRRVESSSVARAFTFVGGW